MLKTFIILGVIFYLLIRFSKYIILGIAWLLGKKLEKEFRKNAEKTQPKRQKVGNLEVIYGQKNDNQQYDYFEEVK